MPVYSFRIDPRPVHLGGGWRLYLFEDGEDMGGGVFPPVDEAETPEKALNEAFSDAQAEGETWIATRSPE